MNHISNNFYPVGDSNFSQFPSDEGVAILRSSSKSPFSPFHMMSKEGSPQPSIRIAEIIANFSKEKLERYCLSESSSSSQFRLQKIQDMVSFCKQEAKDFPRIYLALETAFQQFSLGVCKETACALELAFSRSTDSISPAIKDVRWGEIELEDCFSHHFQNTASSLNIGEKLVKLSLASIKEEGSFEKTLLSFFFAGKITSHLLVKIRESFEGNWPESRNENKTVSLLSHDFCLSFSSLILEAYEEINSQGFVAENFVLLCKEKIASYFDRTDFYQLFPQNKVSLIVLPFKESFLEIFSKDEELYQEMVERFS